MEQLTKEDFSEFLVNMRNSLGMSQERFGKLTGHSPRTIEKWEREENFPRLVNEKVEKIREIVKREMERRRKKKA